MANEERKEEDLFIKPKRRAKNFFITSSVKMDNDKGVSKTTISSSVFTKMSQSFADGDYLLDDGIREINGSVLYMLQEIQGDIDDLYNEASASAFQSSFFPFARIDSGSFGLISSSLVPGIDNKYDLGASGKEWNDLYIDGTANIDSLAMGTTVTSIKDEDNMSSDSNTALATQQSIKKYVDDNAGGGGTIDSSITNGSTNAVQNDAIHDALALKATTAGVQGDLLPSVDGKWDLGSSTKEWQDLHIDGTANIDRLDVGTISNLIPTIPAGKAGGQTIGTSKARWSSIFLASTIDVSGSNLVISSPSASAEGTEFNVIVSGSIVPGDLESGSIGTLEKPFKDLYVQSSSLYFADMSDHNGKTWKQMSKSERLNRATIFQKKDVDKMKRGESLNDSGNISASGDFHVVGRTHLKGITLIEGNTTISGLTDVKGGFRVNGQAITDAELKSLRGLSTDDSLQEQLNAKLSKSGGALTGPLTTNSTIDGVDIATRDGVLTSTKTTADAALPKTGGAMTGAITTNSTFDGVDVAACNALATKALPKTGGIMLGLIKERFATVTSINKFTVDVRAIAILEILMKTENFTLLVATPAFAGQELTIIALTAGIIRHAGKPQAGNFSFANGSHLSVSAGQAYKFVTDSNSVWRQIH